MTLHICSAPLLELQPYKLPLFRLLPSKTLFFTSRKNLGFCYKSVCSTTNTRTMEAPLTVKETIVLTELEEKIFQRLLDAVRHFQLGTELRVAGGWVRDKLLGKDCDDIDIALDNMLGREFSEKVNEYLKSVGEEEGRECIIKSNPKQSKHLETARMRLYDAWIDFVNLRSETYAENSRIPTMEFGSATEDAYRRDLTINSLFYNINTKSVEDLTGRGVQDLKAGLIVTPLPPKDTFLDDPLRVLRAIRFGARFNFVLDEELKKAASDIEVRAAIAEKISRERIGHEIDLMIFGNHPVKAMTYVCDLQLFSSVFTFPENPQPSPIDGCDRLCVSYMDAAWNLMQLIGHSIFSDEQQRLYLYGAFFLPLRNMVYKDMKSKKIPVTNHIFGSSLKLKDSYANMVMKLHAESEQFISLISFLETNENYKFFEAELKDEFLDIPSSFRGRVLSGLLLFNIKEYWRVALLLSCLLHPKANLCDDFRNLHIELDIARDIFLRVQSVIADLDLDNVWNMKPLLDGKAIMGALKLKTGGPKIAEWQQRIRKWQLACPEGTAEECIEWIERSQAKRLKLDSSA